MLCLRSHYAHRGHDPFWFRVDVDTFDIHLLCLRVVNHDVMNLGSDEHGQWVFVHRVIASVLPRLQPSDGVPSGDTSTGVQLLGSAWSRQQYTVSGPSGTTIRYTDGDIRGCEWRWWQRGRYLFVITIARIVPVGRLTMLTPASVGDPSGDTTTGAGLRHWYLRSRSQGTWREWPLWGHLANATALDRCLRGRSPSSERPP